jgi:membrane protein DedA with SNARE-associated domain
LVHFAHAADLFVARYGLFALFILITIEEAGIWLPVPSDLFIIYFASRVVHAHDPMIAAAELLFVVVAGVVCGSLLLYLLARRYRRLLDHLGRLFHIDRHRLARMQSWVKGHGPIVIVPVRLIPGLRILPTVVCGSSAVPVDVFLPMVALSAFLWGSIMFGIGAGGGAALMSFHGAQLADAGKWLLPPAFVAALIVVLTVWRPWKLAGANRK